ncbi:uncharacterized protein LOC103712692 [Phoenix dactylifera]|uniref:Uncharacterized protein LOC103712692 n=1 Tax=Phoenix dactylifera TaxID=42345 RepID=A0A8B7CEQ9_PHODC|nr:uncharacterized protein LOC103712692 [Phoenix dactylifera]XP_008797503.1 uncharacterized protein LOC103712692 [Phoenix dactylifera]XP_008797504.1 uncharacterized protein LOC103712692 [Phoenix dactylifera]XP_008797505.1 uncharacterized protein LOC103712692 [Phoenix dactylifera]
MSDMKAAEANEQLSADNNVKEKVDEDASDEGPLILDQTEENAMPSSQEEEEAVKKKYGGMLPKKPPLISKDHERAYFDSADWALGKQGGQPHKPKGPLEALRPKLQPTPQQQVRSRRSVYASSDTEDGGNAAAEDVNNNNSTDCENGNNP